MIHVLHIITTITIGGAEMMLYNLCSRTSSHRFMHTILVLQNPGPVAPMLNSIGSETFFLNLNEKTSLPKAFPKLLKLVRILKPDVIQGWMYHGNLAASLAKLFYHSRVPVVWNIRHSLYDIGLEKIATRPVIRIGAWLSGIADRVIYNSRISMRQHGKFGYSSKKNSFIPNGFDTSIFKPDPQAGKALRAELGLSADCLLVGLIARYHPLKDHHCFLKAASKLRKKNPQLKYVLVGRGVDKSNMQLIQIINDLALKKAVHLLGERRDIPKLTSGLDIMCSSSISEGFPNTIGEAMTCAVPCIATDVGDTAFLMDGTGLIIPPSNPDALAKALDQFSCATFESLKTIGRKGRARIQNHFEIKMIAQKYERLYHQLVEHKVV